MKIDKSGSGVIDMELLPFDELQKVLVETNSLAAVQEAVDGYDGATFESTTVDGRIAYRLHVPFDDYHDVADVLTNGLMVAGVNARLFSEFELIESAGNWRLNATLAPEMFSDDLRADPSMQQLLDSAGLVALNTDLRLSISLPGKIVRTNGERTASGTAQWSLKKGTSPTFMMATEPSPLLTLTQRIFLGAALAIVLGVVFIVWGSRTEWKGSIERKERRRAKRLTFRSPKGAGKGAGWQNSGPIAPVAEGSMPTTGPMPPRLVPSLGESTAVASTTQIVTPPISSLPPVAPPVAPVVDQSIPDPFAPHRPGASPTDDPMASSASPEAPHISAPVAPVVDPNIPNPFAPHVPGAPAGGGPVDAPIAQAPETPAVPPASDYFLGDPASDHGTAESFADAVRFDADPDPVGLESDAPSFATTPITDPTPLDHPGFVFDGTPGWFSLDAEDDGAHPRVDEPSLAFVADGVGHAADPVLGEGDVSTSDPAAASVDLASDGLDDGGVERTDSSQGGIPAGWYPDPDDPNRYRWWDGGDWTDYVSGDEH